MMILVNYCYKVAFLRGAPQREDQEEKGGQGVGNKNSHAHTQGRKRLTSCFGYSRIIVLRGLLW